MCLSKAFITDFVFMFAAIIRSKKVIKLVPEYLLKKRKEYQAIKATQAKLALLEKRKVSGLLLSLLSLFGKCLKVEYR